MLQITKDTKIEEIIRANFMALFTLKKYGLNCADCPVKKNDTIEACAKVHDIDLETLINDLQKRMK